MLNLFASLVLNLVVSSTPGNAVLSPCEWVGPRVDGISVKVCDGTAVEYRDAAGNVARPGDWR